MTATLMTDEELRAWHRDRAAKVVRPQEESLSGISLAVARGAFSPEQPADYVCRVCADRLSFYPAHPGPRVTMWRRPPCKCEIAADASAADAEEVSEEAIQNRDAIERKKRLDLLGFDRNQRSVRFGELTPRSTDMIYATDALRAWCDSRISGNLLQRGYMVTSTDVGCGKTTLLMKCANYLVDGGIYCAFFTLSTLLDAIRAEQCSGGRTKAMAERVPVLVIDDIGAPSVQTAWQADALYDVLDARAQRRLPILSSSNIIDSRQRGRTIRARILAPRPEEFPDAAVTAARIESRLLFLSEPMCVEGPDLRRGL